MTDADQPISTVDQDQWCEIVAGVKTQLAKMVSIIPAMEPGEVQSFLSAIDTAMFSEIRAKSFDQAVEQHRIMLERESLYGG